VLSVNISKNRSKTDNTKLQNRHGGIIRDLHATQATTITEAKDTDRTEETARKDDGISSRKSFDDDDRHERKPTTSGSSNGSSQL
jgi:hypothetical protein